MIHWHSRHISCSHGLCAEIRVPSAAFKAFREGFQGDYGVRLQFPLGWLCVSHFRYSVFIDVYANSKMQHILQSDTS